jgi:Tol biopolymer transport system component
VSHYSPGVGHGDIHVHDGERHLDTRVTFDDYDDQSAIWSPDGRTLAVTTTSPAASDVYLVDPARPGERHLRCRGERTIGAEAWFPDGGLMLQINDKDGRYDLFRLPPGENAELVPAVVTPFSEYSPSLTRDGRWLAYVGDSTGREEVYVRSLDSGEEWRLSKEGGTTPLWRGDGREIFYLDPRGVIVAVPTTIGTTLTMGAPSPLFTANLDDATGRQYDATPDGRQFILNRRKETAELPIVVTLGFPEKPGADQRP